MAAVASYLADTSALARLRHRPVAAVLGPMIRSLTPGQRVLLVIPTSFTKEPRWMDLIYLDSKSWLRYLRHDRRLRLIATAAPHRWSANVGVAGYLFAVR